MTGILEGLEDWGVDQLVADVIKPYVANGDIPAKDVPLFQKVGVDVANAVIAEAAKKVGVTAQPGEQ